MTISVVQHVSLFYSVLEVAVEVEKAEKNRSMANKAGTNPVRGGIFIACLM